MKVMNERDEMLALLRDLEWSGSSGMEGEDVCCPECGSLKDDIARNKESGTDDEHGHSPDCRLSRFIHGPISAEWLQVIAKRQEESSARQREYEALYTEEKARRQRKALADMQDWQDNAFTEYVRQRKELLPGLPK